MHSRRYCIVPLLLEVVAISLASATVHQLSHYNSLDRVDDVLKKRSCLFHLLRCKGGNAEPELDNNLPNLDEDSERKRIDEPEYSISNKKTPPFSRPQKIRQTPDVIWKLIEKHGIQDESHELRQMIMERAQEYVEELKLAPSGGKIPDPLRVLHSVSPKIPAIKHSPNIMLRITSATSDKDAGAAACTIAMIARLCELYDQKRFSQGEKTRSTGLDIIKDRRFEQLVECILCGVDVEKGKRETFDMKHESPTEYQDCHNIETLLDGEDSKADEGLTVTDSCRAAWGLAILGGYNLESFGGENAKDILVALSLRIQELLLGRLQKLRLGDIEPNTAQDLTLTQRFDRSAECLAEDAVVAMWTFACVKACTGLRSVSLFEICCSILCQNPTDLRRRAQANKTGFDDTNFEMNDVVERLARSTVGVVVPDSINIKVHLRDALIDWLTPNEVTDAIWSLALHGSTNDVRLLHQKKLSETSATFREIAFDRLMEWLQKDELHKCWLAEEPSQGLVRETSRGTLALQNEGGSTVVEVVDAAVILAMERSTDSIVATLKNVHVHDTTDPSLAGGVEEHQAANSDEFLAAPEQEGNKKSETELFATLRNTLWPQKMGSSPQFDESESSQTHLTFLPHNLCAIAWAATDLNDSSRERIVDLIVNVFVSRGRDRCSGLVGGDWANLAWAVAKRSDTGSTEGNGFNATSCLTVTNWIAHEVLSLGINQNNEVEQSILLQHFQPPEIGRLVWSIVWTTTLLLDSSTVTSPDAIQLTALCLRLAASNLSVFGTEDLARIAWAFLMTYHRDNELIDPSVAEPLGQILSTLETSLLRWESGQQAGPTSYQDTPQVEDSVRFASFLGRPRILSPNLLDQRVSEFDIDDDVLPAMSENPSLPLLRDLSTDPATLCKLASGLAMFASNHPEIKGSWTIARTAVRLLVSRNGTLMKEASMKDVIRLCFACASNKIPGYGRETVTRLYARHVLQLLNHILNVPTEIGIDASTLLRVSPWDLSTLIWSLGELGVHHEKVDDNPWSAHRKLYFITGQTLLSDDRIAILSTASLTTFLIGLCTMDFTSSDPMFVARVLRELNTREIMDLQHSEFCSLIEILAKVRGVIEVGKTVIHTEIKSTLQESSQGLQAEDSSAAPSVTNTTSGNGAENVVITMPDEKIVREEIFSLTQKILTRATEQAIDRIGQLSPEQLRRLLIVVTVSPFEASPFVDSVEREVYNRSTGTSQELKSIRGMIFTATENAGRLKNLSSGGRPESDSPLSAFTSTMRSLFYHSEGGNTPSSEQQISQSVKESSDLLHEIAVQMLETTDRLRAIAKISGSDIVAMLQIIEEGANFELGRCKELIAAYRRIDFKTCTRLSRYDKERRKDIGKRLLSRRFL